MSHNVGNLDVSRGVAGTVEIRVRHVSHLLDATAMRMPPTVAVLSDNEARRLQAIIDELLRQPPPKTRPSKAKAEEDDFSDIA